MPASGQDVTRDHVLIVVLEDYCHVAPLSRVVPPDHWSRFESRVQENTERTLDLLDEIGAKATFFVLGWIAEHQPWIVAEVRRRGHEVASKGFMHRSIKQMTPDQFREDVRRSKYAIEDAVGVAVRGYRVPRGGFNRDDLWALDILAEEGFEYDSSLRPLGLGFSDEPFRRYIHRHESPSGLGIWEVPLSTYKVGSFVLPVSGGNYLRQLPHAFIRRAIDNWTAKEPSPLVFYFHVWELDPEQPRIHAVPRLERIRQYRHLDEMGDRIRYYLERYRFGSVGQHLQLPAEEPVPVRAAAPVVTAAAPVAKVVPNKPAVPISVVVPCFNEEDTLGYLANTLTSFSRSVEGQYDVQYVFVDDGSKDKTWDRLIELFGSRPDCQVVRHPVNRGIAAATLTGIHNSRTDIVCAIDADGTFDPHQLKDMIPLLKPGVDVVTASCLHEQGAILNVPAWRMGLSKGASLLYRAVLHNKLSHYTSCFRVYRRRSMVSLELRNERYVGITEILAQLDLQGAKIVEFPAVLAVRVLGQSKMKILRTIGGHLQLVSHLVGERLSETFSSRHETAGKGQHS